MSLAAFELTFILTAFLLISAKAEQTQIITELSIFAWPAIIEVPFVFVFILKLYFSHVIQAAVPKSTSLSYAVLSHSRLVTVSVGIFVNAMAVCLVIYELRYQCALVFEYHFSLANSTIV
jgi:hypothetical protein